MDNILRTPRPQTQRVNPMLGHISVFMIEILETWFLSARENVDLKERIIKTEQRLQSWKS